MAPFNRFPGLHKSASIASGVIGEVTADGDAALVARCLAGEQAAWSQLYEICQPVLLFTVRDVLAPPTPGREVCDEVAARVWCRLLDDDCALLRNYDRNRNCRITTYVTAICRHQALNFRKAERRRREHESSRRTSSGRSETVDFFTNGIPPAEFVERLTPTERIFCQAYLLAADTSADPPRIALSKTNARKLRSRIRRKLERFMRRD